mgnify:CR=1 FL=1
MLRARGEPHAFDVLRGSLKIGRVDWPLLGEHNQLNALAAIAAGKHVHCEKPLSPSLADSLAMVEAAEKAGVATQVGFNYIKNPLLKQARDMIAAGELGEITGFRGIHAEDYMANPDGPYVWRLDASGGPGVIADLGSHIIGMARFLLGAITEVTADVETVVKSRPVSPGSSERKPVHVDDISRLMVRFARGCGGTTVPTPWSGATSWRRGPGRPPAAMAGSCRRANSWSGAAPNRRSGAWPSAPSRPNRCSRRRSRPNRPGATCASGWSSRSASGWKATSTTLWRCAGPGRGR